ncbi:MAG: glycerophosphodiester phosphodiesterase [Scytonema sp. RU_4_4]|nr:glycerophosphodiester phosphodiesterase [Scytonema sp. RU_4_4]NJR72923.1 glycerophosphodiester phosphodiesterase [Scytonema sp. CRU_2_7]
MTQRKNFLLSKKCKYVLLPLGGVTTLILGLFAYLYFPRPLPSKPSSFTLIAHRAVSQTHPLDNLENDTCTAKIIYPPTHNFLENTILAIREAFKHGADIVEFDIHPTTDNQLAVFHDWSIDCRTNGKGITHEQSMKYLKTLDIGYGYTPDNGKTYPFRGKFVGMMPTFDEVMRKFPDKKFLVDQKDTFDKTIKLLAESLKKYPPQQRQNIYLFSGEELHETLKKEVPEVQKLFPTRKEAKDCLSQYLMMLFSGNVSKSCNKYAIGAPARYLKYVPGWPNLVLVKAREAGLKVYVVDVDTKEELEQVQDLPIDGIITNRIEVIGPLLKR